MEPFRCLIVDDSPRELSQLKDKVEGAWVQLNYGVRLEVETIDQWTKALETVSSDPTRFGLALVDIVDQETGHNPGHDLIEDLLRIEGIAVIAVSVNPTAVTHAADLGAHEGVLKDDLYQNPRNRSMLAEKIANALRKANVSPIPLASVVLTYDVDDLHARAAVEMIGQDALKSVTCCFLNEIPARIGIKHVTSGLSGAHVLEAICDVGPGTRRDLLLKLDRSKASLEAELDGRAATRFFQDGLFTGFRDEGICESHGWYALASDFRDGSTLIGWLQTNPHSKNVSFAMERLLGDQGLGRGYRDTSRILDDQRPGDVIRTQLLNPSRSARVDLALDELRKPASRQMKATTSIFKGVRLFLNEGAFGGELHHAKPGTWTVKCHGDLHGRNVLIDPGHVPVLIDPANIGDLHWATDLVRLAVDIYVSCLVKGPSAFYWDDLADWVSEATRFIKGDIDWSNWVRQPPTAPRHALSHLRTVGLPGAMETHPQADAELQLALACEFLRAGYRHTELPAPRRALGLLAGGEGLSAAAKKFAQL